MSFDLELAGGLVGDSNFPKMIVLGASWQNGMIPLSYEAILRSIELNGAAVERNKKAFDFGRWAILHPDQAASMITSDVVSLPKRIEDTIMLCWRLYRKKTEPERKN